MMAKFEPGKKNCGDPGSGRLLHELEVLSKALYLDKNPPNGMVSVSGGRSKSAGKTHASDIKLKTRFLKEDLSHKYMDSSQKDKKSLWGWKALKALSHIRSRRFNCCFSLQVHSIEGLPPNFNGVSLCVRWKRKEGELQTRSARVLEGTAEFEEILTYCCPVYGSRNGPHHSAKYEAKHFLLYASVDGSPNLDLGKHRIDLTRLLPLTLEELEEEKSSGKWTTSFKLSGKAKGAALNVSFGFLVIGDGRVESTGNRNAPQPLNLKQNRLSATKPVIDLDLWDSKGLHRRAGSLPSRSVEDAKILHEVLPTSRSELSTAVSLLYQKPDESKFSSLLDSRPKFKVSSEKVEPLKPNSDSPSECARGDCENLCEDPEFAVVEKGIEISEKKEVKLECSTEEAVGDSSVETIKVSDINKGDEMSPEEDSKTNPQDEAYGNYRKELLVNDFDSKENNICTKESVMEELEQAFHNLSLLESEVLDSPRTKCESPEQADYTEAKLNYKASKMGKSLSLDDATASVASEFLSMLGIDHSPFGLSSDSDPESPRERLLRQFEKDTLAGGNYIFDFDCGKESGFGYDALTGPGWGEFSEGFQRTSVVQDAESEHHWETKAMENKTRVKMLEDLETEALMREWGLNEKIFQSSPPDNSGGFGSPIHLPPEELLELPPLAEGLGPFVQTKDGGFLRSMNPSLFKNAKNGGSLIMQVSSPVVVPAEMGSGIMEILQRLASVGIEKLSMQANKLMPLEDITGKTIHQVAWETAPCLEASERYFSSPLALVYEV
uniref:C2 NT-type domain-containing protein n=1 Tax=Nelumbo nucifera TaxID=4432 RepID=A0A822ZUZ0_NELNU|nr:TPA_asm: hypothetical protein HUJ06_018999 [Nelumbo nucifera]